MSADDRSLSIYFKDTNSDTFYSTFSDINPAINEQRVQMFGSSIQEFTDGELVRTVQNDKTIIYPTAESPDGGE